MGQQKTSALKHGLLLIDDWGMRREKYIQKQISGYVHLRIPLEI